MIEHTNILTGMTDKERKSCFVWVASIPEDIAMRIFQSSVKIFFALKDEHKDLGGSLLKYCAFFLACKKNGWDTVKKKGYRIAEEEQFNDFSNLRRSKAADYIQRGRSPVIRKKVLAYWGEIKELKTKGNGFRTIAKYMSTTRNITISATYIRDLWNEVEK